MNPPKSNEIFPNARVIRLFVRAAMIVGVAASCILPIRAQQQAPNQSADTDAVSAQTMQRVQQHIAELEAEVAELKAQMKELRSTASPSPPASGANAR